MAGLDELKLLLMDRMFGEFGLENGRRFAMLKETGIDAKLKKVMIYDVPENTVLLKLDEYEQPHTLFKEGNGQRCRCDYVLITEIGTSKYIIFIEMKSKNFKNNNVIKQFKGAECLIDYCDSALNRFYDLNDKLKHYKKRFVLFYKSTSVRKSPSRQPSSNRNSTPDSMLKYPNPVNPTISSLVVA